MRQSSHSIPFTTTLKEKTREERKNNKNMAHAISFYLLPLMISICLCFSLLPNLIAAHQTNTIDADFATNLIEKACRHSLEKEVCIDALKLMPDGPEGTAGLNRLAETALKGALNTSKEALNLINDFIKEDTEGESYNQLLFGCALNYFEAGNDVEHALEYLNANDFANVATKVNHANGMVKSCGQKLWSEPGHSQSLLINKDRKMFGRLSNFAVVITRLSAATQH